MDSSSKNIEINLKKVERFAINASVAKAKIIVFPELAVSGYETGHPELLAETIPGRTTEFVLNLAGSNSIVIVVGMIEKDIRNNFYITQIVAFPDGRLEKYRKTHLGSKEGKVYSNGNNLPVFKMVDNDNNEITFALSVCYDTHFPEIFSIYSMRGAQIVFAPHASPIKSARRIQIWDKYLGARAYDNTFYVVAVNHVYNKAGENKGGGAAIWSYKSNIEKSFIQEGEALFFHEFDIEKLNKKRSKKSRVFYIKNRRNEFYKENMIDN